MTFSSSDQKRCDDCRHSTTAYGGLLCLRWHNPHPTSFCRDPQSQCGPDAKYWEAKTRGDRYGE